MNENLHGIMAEFREPEQLLNAARAAYRAGYRKMDAYSPYEVEGLSEAIGFRKTRLPLLILLGGVSGAVTAYGMQWYSAAVDYPLNVGMWSERYVIVITSLHRDFLPSSWGIFHGTRWDWMTLLGSFGLFFTLLFLFLRVLPAISISEMRQLVHKKEKRER